MNSYSAVFCFIGPSGSGKTTTIEILIKILKQYKIATIKFVHHPNLGIDKEGKDTFRHREAGALYTLSFSPKETGIFINRDLRDNLDILPEILKINKKILPKVDLFFCESLNNPPVGLNIIICASNVIELDQYTEKVSGKKIVGITGKICEIRKIWRSIPIFNTFDMESMKELSKLIVKKVIEKK